jgi:PAS domain S-box-containing protein
MATAPQKPRSTPAPPATAPRRPEAWFIADADGKCLAANAQWGLFAGLSPGEPLAGKRWERAIHPDERAGVAAQVSLLCNFGDGYRGECSVERPDGERAPVLVSVLPVAVPGHPEAAYAGVIVDNSPAAAPPASRPGEVEPWAVAAYSAARERLLALRPSA